MAVTNSVVWLLHQLQAREHSLGTSPKTSVIRNHDVIHDTKFPVRYGAMCPGAPNRTVERTPVRPSSGVLQQPSKQKDLIQPRLSRGRGRRHTFCCSAGLLSHQVFKHVKSAGVEAR